MSLDFLKPMGNFKYSVNIEFDLQNDDKVKSYIPTSGSLMIIKDILYSVMSKDDHKTRARLLTGAYGKGKSHLTLTILALLSGRDKKLFKNLLAKSKQVDEELYNNIKLYMESGNKLLPVIINTASNSLKTNFLNSLDIALKTNGLESLMPDTFFDVAISTIKNWQDAFPQTYKSMERLMGYCGTEIIDKLEQYNQSIYNAFVDVYPRLTSGSIFNPMVGADTAKLYETVIKNLKKYGYKGIFVVYDEFGKFLEGSADTKSTADDLKLLQDMAELSERTGIDEQMNLLLISHKGIDNYVSNLPKEKIDNWKAIAGRFYKMSIQSKDEEIYDIIATVLHKEKAYADFIKLHAKEFEQLEKKVDIGNTTSTAFKTGAFKDVVNAVGVKFVEECYPLHPYSLLILPKVSELVAQNERSIFTYLTSSEKNSVTYFAKRTSDSFPIIEPDRIYDYFESLFKGEQYGSPIREQWEIATAAIAKLSSCDNELAVKIVKTITLIYIINEFDILPPSSDLIYEIYSLYKPMEISAAFEVLRKEELLIELEFKPFVKIRKSSNNNIKELMDNEIAAIRNLNIKEILLDNTDTKYFYPVNYNDEQEIIRYFKFMFVTYQEIKAMTDMDAFMDRVESDGILMAILVDCDDELEDAVDLAKHLNNNRVVYIIPNEVKNIERHLRKFQAINNLISKKSNDQLLVDELEYIRQDLLDLIKDYISRYYIKPEAGKTQYIYGGEIIKVKRRKNLSALLSNICENIFAKTPKIVNENINKNVLSATMTNVRKKIIDGILLDNIKPNLDLVGSQNINVLRSVYVVTGLIPDLDNPEIDYDNCNAEVKGVLNEIEKFFSSASENRQCFSGLYDVLVKPKYGYGLKRGVIPFYLAIVIRKHKQSLVVYNKNRELEIDSELLMSINRNPAQYEVKVENLGTDEEVYLTALKTCFDSYGKASDMELSRFDYIVKAMQRWYFQLSKYDRETRYGVVKNEFVELTNPVKKFKSNLGNPELNPREFLFDKLPKIFKTEDLTVLQGKIKIAKQDIDHNLKNVIEKFKTDLLSKLNAKTGASLYSTLQDYYDGLKDTTRNHVFNCNANELLDVIRNSNNDDDRTIRLLVKSMASLRINDFTDELMQNVFELISDSIETINAYDQEEHSDRVSANSYVVRFNNANGESQELQFDNMDEMSYQANMFYNEIISAIEDFNESLTSAEKGQIMLKIIKELNE